MNSKKYTVDESIIKKILTTPKYKNCKCSYKS